MIPRLPRLKPPPPLSSSLYHHPNLVPHRLPFSTTTQYRLEQKTHYEILNLPPTVSHADLKKQFYVLSKETHPDMHPNDPQAGDRFAEISESYSVLADPERRKRYDRDVMRRRQPQGGRGGGSYAGSRPATGLSKRRSAFRGPPPSYYANINQTAKDRAGPSQGTAGSGDHAGGTFNASAYTSEGGYDPAFDSESIYRTQTQEDSRRNHRRAAAMAEAQALAEEEGNFWARFVVVTGIVVFGVTVASVVAGTSSNPKGGLVKGDGSRRGGSEKGNAKGK